MKRWIAALVFGVGSANAAPPVHPPPGQVQAVALPVIEAQIEKDRETEGPILTQQQYEDHEAGDDGSANCEVDVGVTSTHAPEGKARYEVSSLSDGKLKTAWVEGVLGPGIGEAITFTLKRNYKSSDDKFDSETDANRIVFGYAFEIVNGYAASQETWRKNLRVKSLKMFFDGKPVALIHLQDSPALQEFSFDHRLIGLIKKGDTFRFEIVEVYREGAKYEDTALSELTPSCRELH